MERENTKPLVPIRLKPRDFTDNMQKKQEMDLLQISKNIIKDEASYKAFLSFLSRGNIGLLQYQMQARIYNERNTATIVNTYSMWKKYGFQVKSGEHGIRVTRDNGGLMSLFDVSQTVNRGDYDEKKLSWDMELAKDLGYKNNDFSHEYLSQNNYIEMAVEKIHNIFPEYTEDKLEPLDRFATVSFMYLLNERLGVDNGHIHFEKIPDTDEYNLLSDVISEITAKAYGDLNTKIKNREKYVPKDYITFKIDYSESPILYSSNREKEDNYTELSFALANKVIGQLDSRQHREREHNDNVGYYNKTFYRINAVIDGKKFAYEGRIDIGDDTKEDLLAYMKESLEYSFRKAESEEKKTSIQEYLDVFIPFLEKNNDLSAKDIKLYKEIMEKADEFYHNSRKKQEKIINVKMTDDEIKEILEADRRIAEERYEAENEIKEKNIGRKKQCKLNIEAIYIMKNIEKESRMATKEEIEIMKKYSGT